MVDIELGWERESSRRAIPSCVLCAIRSEYSEQGGNYTWMPKGMTRGLDKFQWHLVTTFEFYSNAINQKFTAKSIPQLHGKDTQKAFYRLHSDLVFGKFSSYKRFRNKHQNIYLHDSCLQAVLGNSLMTIDTKSPDQSVAQLTTTTYTLRYCTITYSCCEISDWTISCSRCEISDDVMVLINLELSSEYVWV